MARKVLAFTSHASFTIATRNLDRTISSSLLSPSSAWIPSAKLIGQSSCLKGRLFILFPRSTSDQPGSDEQKFLEASMAYVAGKPIMSDKEYDELKLRLKLPEPFSFIFIWFAAVPLIVWLALTITKLIIEDLLILKGSCPNCGTENTSFFRTILLISTGGSINNIKCSK